MTNIFIMRHANAQSIKSFGSDKDRTLSKKGINELVSINALTQRPLKDISLVLCSSSVRTRETLWHVLPSLRCVSTIFYLDNLYHADHETLLDEINTQIHKFSDILVVGHNPGVSNFYNQVVSNSMSHYLDLPTSSIVEYTCSSPNDYITFSDLHIRNIYLPTA